MAGIDSAWKAWSSLRRFNRTDRRDREIVVYAESRADWPHLGPIVEELTGAMGRTVSYVTSDSEDPALSTDNPGLRTFFVGSGASRTAFFRLVDATALVMTMPDLETFHLKRSVHPVRYVYVFHSMVSTHMIYRKGAFDAYDTIMCVGPHHVAEIRRAEEVYRLPSKELVEHGYGRLDTILREASERQVPASPHGDGRNLLLAPSWGQCSFIEVPYGAQLIRTLLDAGHSVTLRLHPMTVRRFPRLARELASRFGGRTFSVETEMTEQRSLLSSDLMISDWSGAALEYAFGLERPVLFIDTPKKVNNVEFESIGLVPIEERMRTEVGAVARADDPTHALSLVDRLCAEPEQYRDRLRAARERAVYNVGRSATIGAAHVARIADGAHPATPAGTAT